MIKDCFLYREGKKKSYDTTVVEKLGNFDQHSNDEDLYI